MKALLLTIFLLPTALFAASPQGFPVMTDYQVTTTASTQVVAANKDRGYMLIQNKGSSTCQFAFGQDLAGLGTDGLFIGTLQNYEPVAAFVKSALYVRCGSVPTVITIAESNW